MVDLPSDAFGLEKAIIGANSVYVGDVEEYHITECEESDKDAIKISNNCAKIISKTYDEKTHQFTVKIKGNAIGKCSLEIENYSLPIEVLSMWLGGDK